MRSSCLSPEWPKLHAPFSICTSSSLLLPPPRGELHFFPNRIKGNPTDLLCYSKTSIYIYIYKGMSCNSDRRRGVYVQRFRKLFADRKVIIPINFSRPVTHKLFKVRWNEVNLQSRWRENALPLSSSPLLSTNLTLTNLPHVTGKSKTPLNGEGGGHSTDHECSFFEKFLEPRLLQSCPPPSSGEDSSNRGCRSTRIDRSDWILNPSREILKTNRWNRGWFDDQCPLVLEWIWLSEWITIHFEMYVGLKYQRGKLQFGKIIFRQFFRNSISIEKRIRNWKFTERERSIYLSDLIIHERGWRVRVCRTVLKKVPPFL